MEKVWGIPDLSHRVLASFWERIQFQRGPDSDKPSRSSASLALALHIDLEFLQVLRTSNWNTNWQPVFGVPLQKFLFQMLHNVLGVELHKSISKNRRHSINVRCMAPVRVVHRSKSNIGFLTSEGGQHHVRRIQRVNKIWWKCSRLFLGIHGRWNGWVSDLN